MRGEPVGDFVPLRRPDVVAHERHAVDVLVKRYVQRVKQRDACARPRAVITGPIDLAGAGVKGRKALEGPGPAGVDVGSPGRGARRV